MSLLVRVIEQKPESKLSRNLDVLNFIPCQDFQRTKSTRRCILTLICHNKKVLCVLFFFKPKVFYSFGQEGPIHLQGTTFWCNCSRRTFPAKKKTFLKAFPKVYICCPPKKYFNISSNVITSLPPSFWTISVSFQN